MSITISDGINSIVFGATAGFHLMGDATVKATGGARIVRDVARTPQNPFVDCQNGGELEWTLPVRVAGSSADDLADKLKDLNAILTAGGTLTDQLASGSTAIVYVMNPTHPIRPNRTQHVESRSAWDGDLVLYTTVTATETPTILYTDEALTLPALLDLGALDGDAPAPLSIDVNAGWDTAANGMSRCFIAVVPGGAVIADYLKQAEDATGWTLCTEGEAGPGGANNAKKLDSVAWDDLYFGVIPAGRYRVLARARRTTSETGYLGLSEDGTTAYQTTTLNAATYRVVDLGEFAADGSLGLYLLGKGSDFVYVDWLLLCPIEDGLASFDCTDWHIDSWQLGDVLTLTGQGGTIHAAAKYMTGSRLYAPCSTHQLLIAAGDESGSEEAPSVAVDVAYTPQHYTWAGA